MNKVASLASALMLPMTTIQQVGAGSAVAVGTVSPEFFPVEEIGYPKAVAKQLALKSCQERGGLNPKIVAATDKTGYGAVAIAIKASREAVIIAASLGNASIREAESRAMKSCLTAGGVDPRLITSFLDTGNEQEQTYSKVIIYLRRTNS